MSATPDRETLAAAVEEFRRGAEVCRKHGLAQMRRDCNRCLADAFLALLAGPLAPGAPGGDGAKAIAAAVVDRAEDEQHTALCGCVGWPSKCLSGYVRRQFSHDPEGITLAAAAVAYSAGRADERAAVLGWLRQRPGWWRTAKCRTEAMLSLGRGEHVGH